MANGTIKGIEDYLDDVREKFPELSRGQLAKILNYGWTQFWVANARGCDVSMRYKDDETCSALVGSLPMDPLTRSKYNRIKWCKRNRYVFERKGKEWDDTYYFGLTDGQYEEMRPQLACRGRKYIELTDVCCYKLKEDIVHNKLLRYVFKFKHAPVGFCYMPHKLRIPVKELEFIGINNK